MLSREGQSKWLLTWKYIRKPVQWSQLPNPIHHLQSFMMSDTLRLAMIMPFILYQSLTWTDIKREKLSQIKERLDLHTRSSVPLALTKCWTIVSQTAKLAFSISLNEDEYIRLQVLLDKERHMLTVVRNE